MQNITDSEFQREVEALKTHRRLSVHRPVLDPDLPGIVTGQMIPRDEGSPLSTSPGGSGGAPLSRGWNPRDGVSLSDDTPSSSFTGTLVRRSGSSNARSTFTARRRGLNNSVSRQENRPGQVPEAEQRGGDVPTAQKPLDPSHLFWVPASVHPEISPSDFRRFLHDHTSRAVREQEDMADSTGTSVSPTSPTGLASENPVEALKQRSTSIARRGSTLRKQYRPEMDGDNDSSIPTRRVGGQGPSRTISQHHAESNAAPQLSIEDLQKLERLAEEASRSSDPSELRSVLRRTMSLSIASSALDQVDALPADSDQDAPLIVPRPGQILRRAARTKIRKSSFSNDGVTSSNEGGSGSQRRRRGAAGASADNREREVTPGRKRTSDGSDTLEDGAENDPSLRAASYAPLMDGVQEPQSRDSYTSEDTQRTSVTSLADSEKSSTSQALRVDETAHGLHEPITPTQSMMSGEYRSPVVPPLGSQGGYFGTSEHFQSNGNAPHDDAMPAIKSAQSTAIDDGSALHHQSLDKLQESTSAFESTRPAPSPPSVPAAPLEIKAEPVVHRDQGVPSGSLPRRSETAPNLFNQTSNGRTSKEKKGGFGLQWLSNWAKDDDHSEKGSKKEKKEKKDRDREGSQTAVGVTATEKEKESSSFLGSLFGKRKTQDESSRHDYHINTPSAAAVTAGSLLDMRAKEGDWAYYNRYPIHIERAVYRLSHIKLANPRRPLYEQVLISNLMFWYLSVINQTQQMQQQQQYQQQQMNQRRMQNQQQHQELPMQVQPHISQVPTEALQENSDDTGSLSIPSSTERPENATAVSSLRTSSVVSDSSDTSRPNRPKVETDLAAHNPTSRSYDGQSAVVNDFGGANYDRTPDLAATDRVDYPGVIVVDREPSLNGRPHQQQIASGQGISRGGSPPLHKSKKSGLVKPNRAPPGTRSAERAIPAAAYGAQHRQLNSEMAAHSSDSQTERTRISPNMTSVRYTGRNAVPSPHSTLNADEHAWLGSQRRSPNSEDRRSDPLNDVSAGRTSNWRDVESTNKGVNRASEPPRGTTRMDADTFPNLDGSVSMVDGWTRQPLQETDSDGVLLNSSKEASAMLDAARLSRSRRR